MSRTGSEGGSWIILDRPKPPAVDDATRYWRDPPPERSVACEYWARQIERGWLPNRRIGRMGYHVATEWFGVYIWEYLHVLYPMIEATRKTRTA
ncbi:hypothetical protein [Nocardia acidivorans]|uniref:hypothetical protein n=1 Tax=Nocardia acidivorans TaxID=404580 RepID=UPI000B087B2E|nr:hypothetical protein [Nocardia acidivorans]